MTPLLPEWVGDVVADVLIASGLLFGLAVAAWIGWELLTAPHQSGDESRLDRLDKVTGHRLPPSKQRGGMS